MKKSAFDANKITSELTSFYEKTYEKTEEKSLCVLSCRGLLEDVFKHAVFGDNSEGRSTTLENLMHAYCNINSASIVSRAGMANTRRCLNDLVHHREKVEKLSRSDIIDLLDKVRKIVGDVLGTEMPLPEKKKNGEKMPPPPEQDLFDVNDEQTRAVLSESRFVLVNGGPGTGKTYLVANRIIHSARQSGGKKVIGLSFTSAAANHLRERFLFKIYGTEDMGLDRLVSISTIHSFALNSLRKYHSEVLGAEFPYTIAGDAGRGGSADPQSLSFDGILDKFLSRLRDDRKFLDFILDATYEIIVDEAQDLGRRETDILATLFRGSDTLRLVVVGDQRQNLYSFRSGSIFNLLNSMDAAPEEIQLSISYRCPPPVLRLVNGLHFSDCENFRLSPPLSDSLREGEDLTYYRAPSERAEVRHIVDTIEGLAEGGAGSGNDERDSVLRETAILTTNSFAFELFAKELSARELPFRTIGGKNDLRTEIRNFVDFVGSLERNSHALGRLSLEAFPDVPDAAARGDDFQDALKRLNEANPGNRLLNLINTFSPESLSGIQCQTRNDPHRMMALFINATNPDDEARGLLTKFSDAIVDRDIFSYDELKENVTPRSEDFLGFCKNPYARSLSLDADTPYITLATIHSAKGNEWNYVFLPGLSEDRLPGYRSVLNDETKKFYVACTRAKKSLFLSSPASYDVRKKDGGSWTRRNAQPSIFLKGLGRSAETGGAAVLPPGSRESGLLRDDLPF